LKIRTDIVALEVRRREGFTDKFFSRAIEALDLFFI